MLRVPLGASDDLRRTILQIAELLLLPRGTVCEASFGVPRHVTLYRREDNVIVVQCGVSDPALADQIAAAVREDGFVVQGLSVDGLRFSVNRGR